MDIRALLKSLKSIEGVELTIKIPASSMKFKNPSAGNKKGNVAALVRWRNEHLRLKAEAEARKPPPEPPKIFLPITETDEPAIGDVIKYECKNVEYEGEITGILEETEELRIKGDGPPLIHISWVTKRQI